MDALQAWNEVETDNSITVAELDEAAKKFCDLRDEYDALSIVAKNKYKEVEQAKYELMQLMELSNKTKVLVEGLGTFSRVQTQSYKVPTDFENKKALIDHFKNLGETEFYRFVSVHSQTLNSYVKEQLENNPDFKLDGCGEPKISSDLRIRRSKK